MRSPKFVHVLYWLGVVALTVALGTSAAWAQTFTGGLRGAVRDANGVIPGVTVELLNEETGINREAVTNEQGEYNFVAVQPGPYTIKAMLTGFKTYENRGVRIAAQQFITMDVTLEVGTLQETITVTGQSPLIDTSNASTGAVLDSETLAVLPSPGRAAFLVGVTVPTVIASGDAQFNRQQDQTNASLVSLGGGARRANNYILDGVPISICGTAPWRIPASRALRKSRCRSTPSTLRWAARAAASSTPQPSRAPTRSAAADSSRRARSGAGEQLLLRARRHPEADRPLLPPLRWRRRRSDHPEPDVLPLRYRGIPLGDDT